MIASPKLNSRGDTHVVELVGPNQFSIHQVARRRALPLAIQLASEGRDVWIEEVGIEHSCVPPTTAIELRHSTQGYVCNLCKAPVIQVRPRHGRTLGDGSRSGWCSRCGKRVPVSLGEARRRCHWFSARIGHPCKFLVGHRGRHRCRHGCCRADRRRV